MTTDELIKQVLEHDAIATPGPWRKGFPRRTESGIEWGAARIEIWAEDDGRGDLGPLVVDMDGFTEETDVFLVAVYRTAAPLLARKLQRALEVLEKLDLDAMVTLSHEVQEIAATAIAEIEAMQ